MYELPKENKLGSHPQSLQFQVEFYRVTGAYLKNCIEDVIEHATKSCHYQTLVNLRKELRVCVLVPLCPRGKNLAYDLKKFFKHPNREFSIEHTIHIANSPSEATLNDLKWWARRWNDLVKKDPSLRIPISQTKEKLLNLYLLHRKSESASGMLEFPDLMIQRWASKKSNIEAQRNPERLFDDELCEIFDNVHASNSTLHCDETLQDFLLPEDPYLSLSTDDIIQRLELKESDLDLRSEAEVQIVAQRVSNRCPILGKKIKIPVIGRNCCHRQTFCLIGMQMYARQRSDIRKKENRRICVWECPICKSDCTPPSDLQLNFGHVNVGTAEQTTFG